MVDVIHLLMSGGSAQHRYHMQGSFISVPSKSLTKPISAGAPAQWLPTLSRKIWILNPKSNVLNLVSGHLPTCAQIHSCILFCVHKNQEAETFKTKCSLRSPGVSDILESWNYGPQTLNPKPESWDPCLPIICLIKP